MVNTNLTYYTGEPGNRTGVGNMTLVANPELCTKETCDLNMANFLYLPSMGGNAALTAIFAILLIGQIGYGVKYKTWGYMTAMIFGLVLEIIGYIARIMLYNNPFNGDAFLMYLITLTIAPAFMTASIYLCLARIINIYGENLSTLKPRTYTLIFCGFDIICLILQAVGGAIASTANKKSGLDLGKNIMVAGLVLQVIALILFMGACSEYAFRIVRGRSRRSTQYQNVYTSRGFKLFLAGLGVAAVAILIRCIYRCAELWGGFNSDLFVSHEATYMILEGAMIALACLCLTIFHPGPAFKGAWDDANFRFRTRKGDGANTKLVSRHSSDDVDVENVRHAPQPYEGAKYGMVQDTSRAGY